ncbi:hypothetical protein HPP92_020143 [Vanilla planifolia]|uniref:Exostosin GT47 domain-containing protein n=1 Tax=Vanilla planifolia TaxID=51239 RepID=A0A835Q1J7_VANPL|nr:hypothetical protein HPP92_020595 [Vanilla planifolia]KAG0465979.1 hypothetical protein HPP92_020143 [Vanilla planifolia]
MRVWRVTPAPMAGKSAFAIPFCSLQRCILAVATLTLLSFSFFSLSSIRSPPPTTPSHYHSQRSSSAAQADDKNPEAEEFFHISSSSVYHFPKIFHASYAEMEKSFKVYIYPDGDPNTYYQTPRKLTGKYASEGYFFQNIRESRFRTMNPDQADLFFIPISCHKMRGKDDSWILGWPSKFKDKSNPCSHMGK